MDATLEHETTGHKLQRKLAESRFFFMSLTIHILLVVFLGGVVLYKAVNDPPDFVAEGGDGLIAQTDSLAPAPEQPADSVPVETVTESAPDVSAPSIDVINTGANTNTFKVATATPKINLNTTGDLAKSTGAVVKGVGGGVGGLPGTMKGRMGTGRARAMAENKMKDKSERAVLRGLEWLRKVQNADGSWGDKNKGAMTGLALLCFLGHGETNESVNYGLTVSKCVQWILDTGTKYQGRLSMTEGAWGGNGGVYEHGICTYALGEYYTMTKDERVVELLKQSIGYIVQGQGPSGGWMYSFDKSANDLSVSGWQIQALKAAHLTGLNLPGVDGALDKAMDTIDKVWKGSEGGYGYRGPENRYSLTGVGILCRLFWKGDRGDVRKGMDWLLDETEKDDRQKPLKYKSDKADLYAWYYHTQAALMFGGGAWQKWNRWFQDEICDVQNPDGSWPAPGFAGHGPQAEESMTGQVYRTTLCILMLEVFYRYMPINKE